MIVSVNVNCMSVEKQLSEVSKVPPEKNFPFSTDEFVRDTTHSLAAGAVVHMVTSLAYDLLASSHDKNVTTYRFFVARCAFRGYSRL